MSLLIKKIAFIFFSIILGGGDLDARLLEVLVDELIREEKTINKRGVRNSRIYLTLRELLSLVQARKELLCVMGSRMVWGCNMDRNFQRMVGILRPPTQVANDILPPSCKPLYI